MKWMTYEAARDRPGYRGIYTGQRGHRELAQLLLQAVQTDELMYTKKIWTLMCRQGCIMFRIPHPFKNVQNSTGLITKQKVSQMAP